MKAEEKQEKPVALSTVQHLLSAVKNNSSIPASLEAALRSADCNQSVETFLREQQEHIYGWGPSAIIALLQAIGYRDDEVDNETLSDLAAWLVSRYIYTGFDHDQKALDGALREFEKHYSRTTYRALVDYYYQDESISARALAKEISADVTARFFAACRRFIFDLKIDSHLNSMRYLRLFTYFFQRSQNRLSAYQVLLNRVAGDDKQVAIALLQRLQRQNLIPDPIYVLLCCQLIDEFSAQVEPCKQWGLDARVVLLEKKIASTPHQNFPFSYLGHLAATYSIGEMIAILEYIQAKHPLLSLDGAIDALHDRREDSYEWSAEQIVELLQVLGHVDGRQMPQKDLNLIFMGNRLFHVVSKGDATVLQSELSVFTEAFPGSTLHALLGRFYDHQSIAAYALQQSTEFAVAFFKACDALSRQCENSESQYSLLFAVRLRDDTAVPAWQILATRVCNSNLNDDSENSGIACLIDLIQERLLPIPIFERIVKHIAKQTDPILVLQKIAAKLIILLSGKNAQEQDQNDAYLKKMIANCCVENIRFFKKNSEYYGVILLAVQLNDVAFLGRLMKYVTMRGIRIAEDLSKQNESPLDLVLAMDKNPNQISMANLLIMPDREIIESLDQNQIDLYDLKFKIIKLLRQHQKTLADSEQRNEITQIIQTVWEKESEIDISTYLNSLNTDFFERPSAKKQRFRFSFGSKTTPENPLSFRDQWQAILQLASSSSAPAFE